MTYKNDKLIKKNGKRNNKISRTWAIHWYQWMFFFSLNRITLARWFFFVKYYIAICYRVNETHISHIYVYLYTFKLQTNVRCLNGDGCAEYNHIRIIAHLISADVTWHGTKYQCTRKIVKYSQIIYLFCIISRWPSGITRRHRTWTTGVQVTACYLMAPIFHPSCSWCFHNVAYFRGFI